MEFGFLTQGYLPADRRTGPDAEHRVLMDDLELCLAAEQAGFKYIWISEHHFLDEYSHISSNDVFLGALGALTTRAHVGSGIFNPLPACTTRRRWRSGSRCSTTSPRGASSSASAAAPAATR